MVELGKYTVALTDRTITTGGVYLAYLKAPTDEELRVKLKFIEVSAQANCQFVIGPANAATGGKNYQPDCNIEHSDRAAAAVVRTGGTVTEKPNASNYRAVVAAALTPIPWELEDDDYVIDRGQAVFIWAKSLSGSTTGDFTIEWIEGVE